MRITPFPITILHPDPPIKAEASLSPDSEAVLIITFTRDDGENLCTAVLLAAHMNVTIEPELGTAFYSIFFPDGSVEIDYGYHYHDPQRKSRPLAFLTTRSAHGEVRQQLHGLG